MKTTAPRLLLCSLATLAPALAVSAEPRFYAGIALGRSSVDGASETNSTAFGGSPPFTPPTSVPLNGVPLDDHDTSWSAFVGYTVTRYVGLELGYWDHGSFGNELFARSFGPTLGIKEFYFGPTLQYPVNNRLSLTASAGVSRAQFDVKGSAFVVILQPGDPFPIFPPGFILRPLEPVPFIQPEDETGGFWRVGVNWRFSNRLETSLSYGRRDLKVQEVKTLALSLSCAF